jgi:hypothetical protein
LIFWHYLFSEPYRGNNFFHPIWHAFVYIQWQCNCQRLSCFTIDWSFTYFFMTLALSVNELSPSPALTLAQTC